MKNTTRLPTPTLESADAYRGAEADCQSSTDDDRLLPSPCASLSGLVYVIEAKAILWRELVIVDRVLCNMIEHTSR